MTEHPFAEFVRALGRGPKMFRDLDAAEAEAAMGMILRGEVEPAQLGAFLLLLRRKGETADELAGFVRAARAVMPPVPAGAVPALDWPSYADRHRQQPWFLLAALLLAVNGVAVMMHGIDGEEGYAATTAALPPLGIAPSPTLADAAAAIARTGFAYVRLRDVCPALEALFHLRPILGVRTAANTLARDLNPLQAPAQILGVVHPPYRDLHRDIAAALGQPRAAVFKGVGGEAQRSPLKDCAVAMLSDGAADEEIWPRRSILPGNEVYRWRDEDLDPALPAQLWAGAVGMPVAEAAVIATAAVALRLVGRAATVTEAEDLAAALWDARPRDRFGTTHG